MYASLSWSPMVRNTQRDHYWICVSLMGSDINVQWLAKIIQFYWEKPLQRTILRRASVLVFTVVITLTRLLFGPTFWFDGEEAANIWLKNLISDLQSEVCLFIWLALTVFVILCVKLREYTVRLSLTPAERNKRVKKRERVEALSYSYHMTVALPLPTLVTLLLWYIYLVSRIHLCNCCQEQSRGWWVNGSGGGGV